MAEHITGFQTKDGVKKYDYNSLANKPDSFSNALKNLVNGETIQIDDVSPVIHEVSCKVKSKNLVAYPFPEKTLTRNGITYTDNGNGTITANGTATANSHFIFKNNADLSVGKYVFGGCPAGGSASTYHMTANGYFGIKSDTGKGGSFEVKADSPQTNFVIIVMAGTTINNLVFRPQIEKGITLSAYTPYVNPAVATITCNGKTYTPGADGTVTGIMSTAPSMTFTTDTANTTIEVDYQRDINILTETVPLIDRVTGIPYYLYVSGGKLLIEEREG